LKPSDTSYNALNSFLDRLKQANTDPANGRTGQQSLTLSKAESSPKAAPYRNPEISLRINTIELEASRVPSQEGVIDMELINLKEKHRAEMQELKLKHHVLLETFKQDDQLTID
jgi:flagellar basal body rod protein FlgF